MNFDSGKNCSTFLTFCGLLAAPGMMASTSALSSVQEVESLRVLISSVSGSEEELPHSVPEQPCEDSDGTLIGAAVEAVAEPPELVE